MWSFAVSIFCLFTGFTVAEGPDCMTKKKKDDDWSGWFKGDYGDCYHINKGIMTMIVVGDLVLTILLLLPVYYCIHQKGLKQRKKDETRNYVNMIGMHK